MVSQNPARRKTRIKGHRKGSHKLTKKQKRNLAFVAAGVAVWYFFLRSASTSNESGVQTVLEPAKVKGGELVSASTYRLIQDRRSAMDYVPADGSLGSTLNFTPSRSGKFTRNLVQDGQSLLAEIA